MLPEQCDGLLTKPVFVLDLPPDAYVLLAGDVDVVDDVPLLIAADFDEPVLFRFVAFEERVPGFLTVWFDAPDEEIELLVGDDAQIRMVLPGQDHPTWGKQ